MKNCLRVLSQPTPPSAGEAELATDQQEREGALELLADLCENMDNAAGTLARPQPPGPAPLLPGLPAVLPLPQHMFHCGSALVLCRGFLSSLPASSLSPSSLL